MVGCAMTMAVQLIIGHAGYHISLATQGVISYPTAAALVLGENIGTTITALLASAVERPPLARTSFRLLSRYLQFMRCAVDHRRFSMVYRLDPDHH
ncbi:MAG: hypothetical protein R3C56_10170 [Pirellulaceae bacterium]